MVCRVNAPWRQDGQPSIFKKEGLGETRDAGKAVETGIKTQNSFYSVPLHDGEVHAIARGKLTIRQDNLLGAVYNCLVNRQHFVDKGEQRVESRLYGLTPVDADIAMQDLLQGFGISDKALTICYQFFQQPLCIRLVRVRRAHEIHRNIRINENHGLSSWR